MGSRSLGTSSSGRLRPLLWLFIVSTALMAAPLYAQTSPLNDTGQTQCFEGGALAECTVGNTGDGSTHPRQDGRFGRDAQAGVGALTKIGSGEAGFDFSKICNSGQAAGSGDCPADPALGAGTNDWACTRDNVTGLIWEVKTPANATATFNFADASAVHADAVNTDQLCGSADWRVPTRRELLSIVHNGTNNPAIDTTFFPNTQSSFYWSSNIFAPNPASAWIVYFDNGNSGANVQTFDLHVRLVSGTMPPEPDPRFEDNSDGTVTDPATGLMWDRCAWGQTGSDCSGDSASTHNWQAALGIAVEANGNNHLGYNDWRLPNRTELESLVDLSTFGPAINTTAFPSTPTDFFWSSTVYTPDPAGAWNVLFVNGSTYAGYQASDFLVRLVRSGQSLDALATQRFPSSGAFQTFTVPAWVNEIEIVACGAEGGTGADPLFSGDTYPGGLGAAATARFAVTPGDELTIIVGQKGGDIADGGGGGGGGSFVVDGSDLLLAAGGGAGGHDENSRPGAGFGGNGSGGSVDDPTSVQGAAGGGFNSSGDDANDPGDGSILGTGGRSFANGFVGGTGAAGGGAGGFGGGGGGRFTNIGGGGGGGYSGGSVRREGAFSTPIANGGTSFAAASALAPSATPGACSGNGSISISFPGGQLSIESGDGQSGIAGETAAPVSVFLRDPENNPVEGAEVIFAVASGGGNVTGEVVMTNASGIATIGSWSLGTMAGTNTLTATAAVASAPVTFTAMGTAGPAANITINDPDNTNNQMATVGTAVATAPSVLVTDQNNNPVAAGVNVSFAVATGNGSVAGAEADTDANGIATIGSWTLGTTAGANTLTATITGSAPAVSTTFTATGTAGTATQMAINAGDGQSAVAGSVVETAPSVIVRDANNNPVADVAVTFAVASGEGTIDPTTPVATDANGIATVNSWTLGATAGTNTLTATAPGLTGSPRTFRATGLLPGAPSRPLNDTGQTQCFQAGTPALGPCTQANAGDGGSHPRQDGRFGRDAQAGEAGFDFTKIANDGSELPDSALLGSGPTDWACTRDNVTGLIWEVKTSDNATDVFNFANASADHATTVNNAALCGYANWRVPARRELLSIVHMGVESPAIDTTFFPNTQSASHWSSDIYTANPVFAWTVRFDDGSTVAADQTALALHVRLVSGTVPSEPNPRFVDNLDGTVTDPATGLIWDRCSWGQTGSDCSGGSASFHNWQAALGIAVEANTANHRGYSDWRLPNRTELNSLVDITTSDPAIDTNAFPNTPSGAETDAPFFWSSTVYTPDPTVAWDVSFSYGFTFPSLQANGGHVRLVRSGQSFDALAPAALGMISQPSSAAQSGVPFPQQPVVEVRDVNDDAVLAAGTDITAAIASGGGTLTGTTTVATDANGQATFTNLAISGSVGDRTLSFSAGSLTPATSETITLSAGTPTQMAINAGDNQSAVAGTAVATAPSVIVADANDNPVAGASITFAVASGGGSVTGESATTNASGIATVGSWTLGTAVGENTLTATSDGLTGSPLLFTATAQNAPPTAPVITAPTPGATVLIEGLLSDLFVPMWTPSTDINGDPVTYRWELGSDAQFSTLLLSVPTGSETQVTLTFEAMEQLLLANGIGVGDSVTLFHRAIASDGTVEVEGSGAEVTLTLGTLLGPPDQMSINAGDGQSATGGTAVAVAPSVLVTDARANPVSGVAVAFAVASGGGSVTGGSATTNASGIATVGGWTLGDTAGMNTLTASAAGLPDVTFTASATTAPAAPTDVSATPGNAEATVSWMSPTDIGGSPITGYIVTGNPGGSCSVAGDVSECTITDLSNGTEYTFTVVATNDEGNSLPSLASESVTPVGPPSGALQAQVEPTILGLVVSWVAPSDNGGTPILSYRADANPSCEVTALVDEVPGETAYSCTIGNLDPGQEYTVTVTAINAVGESTVVAGAGATPMPAAIPVPTLNTWALFGLMLLMLLMAMPVLLRPRFQA